MKKVSVFIISLLIALCSFIPAFADVVAPTEPDTTTSDYDFSFNLNNEDETEEETEEDTSTPEEYLIGPEDPDEDTSSDDVSVPSVDEVLTMTADELENYTAPAEEEEHEIPSSPYTTITIKGLKSKVTMTLKNMSTGEKFKILLNRENEFTTRFEGPEGTYKITLKTNEVSVRAGKIFNDKKEVVKTIEIKRTNNWQNIILTSSIRPTFNVLILIKRHWLILSLFAGVNIAYYIVKKHRVLPSKPL